VRPSAPFRREDLEELGDFLHLAERVVPMYDVARGDTGAGVIGLRHDVDDNEGSLDTAVRMAEWEFEQGFASTYFLLHDSYYWGEEVLFVAEQLEDLGHEVGLHINGIAESLRQHRDARLIVREAVDYLRTAVRVVGCVAHGDHLCRKGHFVNDEMFTESRRPGYGDSDRQIVIDEMSTKINPVPRSDFGFEYDPNWLGRGNYLSDSGGKWSQPWCAIADVFPERSQLHMLVHPDWWSRAFLEVTV
jgi:hypothetical protein